MAIPNQFETLRALVDRLIEGETRIFAIRRDEAFESERQATPDEVAKYHRERELAERQLAASCADCLAFGASIGIESEALANGLSTLQTNVVSLNEWQSTRFRPVWSYAEDRSLGGWLDADETLNKSIRKVKDALTQPVFLRLMAQVPHASSFDGSEVETASAGALLSDAANKLSLQAAPSAARDDDDDGFVFDVGSEIVEVRGFSETVTLERSEGVDRLIAIVTAPTRRVGVMELAKIGSAQQVLDRDSIDRDADGLTERESVYDEQFESALGDDAPQIVRDKVGELIAQKEAANKRGDVAAAKSLKQQIDAILAPLKTELQKAAKTVRNSLNRTYERLRKDGKGTKLAAHFEKCVERPHKSAEFVYELDERERKIIWSVK